jgi:hypothetical protein
MDYTDVYFLQDLVALGALLIAALYLWERRQRHGRKRSRKTRNPA